MSVLWLLVAITSASMVLGLAARRHRLFAATRAETALARWAAAGSIEFARAELSSRLIQHDSGDSFNSATLDPLMRFDTLVTRDQSFGDIECRLTLGDPASKLNLNRASRTELHRFFFAVTGDPELSSALSQAIAAWRGDVTPGEFDLEQQNYLAAGKAVTPPGRAFYSVAELKHVREMSAALYERVADHMTVVGLGQVNLNTASEPVLRSVPGISDELAALVLRMRGRGEPVTELMQLSSDLSSKSRQELLVNFAEMSARTITRATQLHLTANAQRKNGFGKYSVEVLLAIDPDLQVAWQRFY